MAGGLEIDAGFEELSDAVELVVDGAHRHPGPAGDLGNGRAGRAFVDERHERVQQGPPVLDALAVTGVETVAVPTFPTTTPAA